jgi:hypothetical protein
MSDHKPPCRCRELGALAIITLAVLMPSDLFAVTPDKLREQARQAITKKLVSVEPPTIQIEGRNLTYYLGGPSPFFAEQFHNQLLGETLGNQILVEVLRRSPRRVLGDSFWNPLFNDVERVIGQQLSLVDGPAATQEDRAQKFQDLSEQIWKTYETAFDREARRRGLVAASQAAAGGPKQVSITTDPPGGKIFLMHALEKQMADLEGRTPDWRPIEDPTSVPVDGVYWYAIQYGDQTKTGAQPIDFSRREDQLEYTLRLAP